MVYEYIKQIENIAYLHYLINKEFTNFIGITNNDNILYIYFNKELTSEELLNLESIINTFNGENMTYTKNAKSFTKQLDLKKTLNNSTYTYFYERNFTNTIYLNYLQFDFDNDNLEIIVEIDDESYHEEPVNLKKEKIKDYFTYDDEKSPDKYSINNGRSLVRISFNNLEINSSIKIKGRSLTGNPVIILKFLTMNYYTNIWSN